MRNIKLIIFL